MGRHENAMTVSPAAPAPAQPSDPAAPAAAEAPGTGEAHPVPTGPPPDWPDPPLDRGLAAADIDARRAAGLGNTAPPPTTRTYLEIVRENVFTFVNNVLFLLAVALVVVGRGFDALVSLGVIGTNIVVAIVQELRAKRMLDRIAVLARPDALVRRDGVDQRVPAEQLVMGDLVGVVPGDQIVLDGQMVQGAIEADESLLTGESDLVHHAPGETVFSGSYCMSGTGWYVVRAVGEASLANRIVAGARGFRRILTPLQREINLVIRMVLFIVVYLQVLLIIQAVVQQIPADRAVGQATILAGLVPNGLFVSIAIAYALAAVRIARMGALVQQSNAVESLSHVDVLCVDKTGTLTTTEFALADVHALDPEHDGDQLRRTLGTVVASAATRNRTAEAIAHACPEAAQPTVADVPFSSARRWSAVAVDPAPGSPIPAGVYVLGAPQSLGPFLRADDAKRAAIETTTRDWARRGLRVLLLAWHPSREGLDAANEALPPDLRPLGLVSLRDVLRPNVSETLRRFQDAGVSVRVISGDDPETVAALLRQAGIDAGLHVVSGADLEGISATQMREAVRNTQVFGRVTPALKADLVGALRAAGHYVAMIGDGVNDVLSLKRSNLAVAMGAGSQATKGVADLILIDDSFGSLANAVEEGNRIRNGMHDILRLFLTRIGTMGLVIVSSLVIGQFPIELRNASAITLFTVGVPSVLLAVWAPAGRNPHVPLVQTLVEFVVPAATVSALIGLVVFYGTLLSTPGPIPGAPPLPAALSEARSALTSLLVLTGLLLVPFVAPVTRWFAVVDDVVGDLRPAVLTVLLAIGFLIVSLIPAGRTFFDLVELSPTAVGLVLGGVGVWLLVIRTVWKARLLHRFFAP